MKSNSGIRGYLVLIIIVLLSINSFFIGAKADYIHGRLKNYSKTYVKNHSFPTPKPEPTVAYKPQVYKPPPKHNILLPASVVGEVKPLNLFDTSN